MRAAARVLMPPFIRPAGRDAPIKIGLVDDEILRDANAVVVQSMETAAAKLRDAGIGAKWRQVPIPLATIIARHKTITEYELARAHPALAGEEHVTPALREAVRRGLAIEAATYEHALAELDLAARDFWMEMRELDALIFPAAPDVAPAGMKTGDPRFIIPFTALGGPIVSIPIAIAPSGLPLGLMLIGAPGTDRGLAAIAERLARAIELPR
jgi:aspartyl-tRNA(Asn)/glutamyl-tRNA(Gln) amidotransferase subunit A